MCLVRFKATGAAVAATGAAALGLEVGATRSSGRSLDVGGVLGAWVGGSAPAVRGCEALGSGRRRPRPKATGACSGKRRDTVQFGGGWEQADVVILFTVLFISDGNSPER